MKRARGTSDNVGKSLSLEGRKSQVINVLTNLINWRVK